MHFIYRTTLENAIDQRSPTFLASGTGFMEDNFSMDGGGGDGFGMIQVHYIYCALVFLQLDGLIWG